MHSSSKDDGVLSLEACLVVPIFIGLMMFLYGLMILFMGQHTISHAAIQCTLSASLDSYAAEKLGGVQNSDLMGLVTDLVSADSEGFIDESKWYAEGNAHEIIRSRFFCYLTGTSSEADADSMLSFLRIAGGASGLDFSKCSVDKSGNLTVSISYDQGFLFNTPDWLSFHRTITLSAKQWGIPQS